MNYTKSTINTTAMAQGTRESGYYWVINTVNNVKWVCFWDGFWLIPGDPQEYSDKVFENIRFQIDERRIIRLENEMGISE